MLKGVPSFSAPAKRVEWFGLVGDMRVTRVGCETYAVLLELAYEHVGEERARLVGVADVLEGFGCIFGCKEQMLVGCWEMKHVDLRTYRFR